MIYMRIYDISIIKFINQPREYTKFKTTYIYRRGLFIYRRGLFIYGRELFL